MTKKPRKRKLSKTQIKLVERMLEGDCIIKSYDERGDIQFTLQSGKTVSAPTFQFMMSLGIIQPKGDGLFGDSQCFSLVEGAAA